MIDEPIAWTKEYLEANKPPLKSLDEHNRDARHRYRLATAPHGNGIACPECGEELMDSDGMILTVIPPKKNVHCPACGYRGYRIA